MTKTDSQILKGIAILFMLWHHLFWCDYYTHLYTSIGLMIHGMPLEQRIAEIVDPVPFFLILSGYGLYKLYSQRRVSPLGWSTFTSNLKRILRVYIHYWITLAIFVPIAGAVYGYRWFPGSMERLTYNVLGWYTSYNQDVWFLYPYAQMVILSGLFYLFVRKVHWLVALAIGVFLNMVQFSWSDYSEMCYLTHHAKPILLPFLLGMIMAKTVNFDRLRAFFRGRAWLAYALLLAYCIFKLYAFRLQAFSAAVFIIFFASLPLHKTVSKVLASVGRRSTSMWFIHSWFCHILCQRFIYSAQYSILVFIVLIAVSYVCSMPIDYAHSRLLRLVGLAKKQSPTVQTDTPEGTSR